MQEEIQKGKCSQGVPTEVFQRENRKWTRVRRDDENETVDLIRESGETNQGRLFDESFDGIGILVDDGAGYQVGQLLEVQYRGVRVGAVVQHIETTPEQPVRMGLQLKLMQPLTGADDDWRIGLSWQRDNRNES